MPFLFYLLVLYWVTLPAVASTALHDPTRPENARDISPINLVQSWELQAIIISQDHPIAIFNGRTVKLGDHLGDFKVVSIRPNTVHLEGPDGNMTLFLFNQSIKRLSAN